MSKFIIRLTTKDFLDAIEREQDPVNKILLKIILESMEEESVREFRKTMGEIEKGCAETHIDFNNYLFFCEQNGEVKCQEK
ncbi:MAG: hypothetical protein WC444_04280 [Candidatus Paceibacterota bacterium]